MIRLPAFAHLAPESAGEAVLMLAEHGPAAALVAGGTGLYPAMKRRQVRPRVLVSLASVGGLRGISTGSDGEVRIGAMTSLAELARAGAGPGAGIAALAAAARAVASPQIRGMGTVGGNLCLDTRCNYFDMPDDWRDAVGPCLKAGGEICQLAPGGSRCWAISACDLAPVAMALECSVRMVGLAGSRTLPLADLYRPDGIDRLAIGPGEILAELLVPAGDGVRACYRKVRRRASIDFPMLGVAVAVRLDRDGACRDARVVLGAVASAPLRCREAEGLLTGRRLTPESIGQAAEAASRPARPLDNADLTHYYRKWVIPVHVARALREVAGAAV